VIIGLVAMITAVVLMSSFGLWTAILSGVGAAVLAMLIVAAVKAGISRTEQAAPCMRHRDGNSNP
jgi:chromate transport protein ChrA